MMINSSAVDSVSGRSELPKVTRVNGDAIGTTVKDTMLRRAPDVGMDQHGEMIELPGSAGHWKNRSG